MIKWILELGLSNAKPTVTSNFRLEKRIFQVVKAASEKYGDKKSKAFWGIGGYFHTERLRPGVWGEWRREERPSST